MPSRASSESATRGSLTGPAPRARPADRGTGLGCGRSHPRQGRRARLVDDPGALPLRSQISVRKMAGRALGQRTSSTRRSPPVRGEVHWSERCRHRRDEKLVAVSRVATTRAPHRLGGRRSPPRLAQRGLHPRTIPLLDDTARKRKLALVMRHARRLLGEEHVRPVVIRHRHQHRRRHQVAPVQRHPRPPAQRRI